MQPIEHGPILNKVGDPDLIALRGGAPGWAVFICPGCKSPSLAQGVFIDGRGKAVDGQFAIGGWWPTQPPVKNYPDSVPEQIASLAAEVHACLGISTCRGAVALARAVVEATAKEKGITVWGIASKIDELYEQHLIYEHVKDAAHEVRLAGNDIAHGDLVTEAITLEEATELVELMDMVLDGVFIAPGKSAAQATRRAERKAANSAP